MQYSQLGNTGVFVSRLCMGAMTFGGASNPLFQAIGGLNQHDTDTLVTQCLEAGINFFDTANVYSRGESETLLGKALGTKRKEVVIASKVFGRMGNGANEVGLSRLHILHEIDASLQRLGTDYIDLYQVHGFDNFTPLEETLSALDAVVRAGKVRYIGCSKLRGVAGDEGAGNFGAEAPGTLHHGTGILFDRRSGSGARAGADDEGSAARAVAVESARWRILER